ncbi:MAG: hypothetical protein RL417_646 [Pseudomonadota bacterium]|jgi:GGDEF domain-containing protein
MIDMREFRNRSPDSTSPDEIACTPAFRVERDLARCSEIAAELEAASLRLPPALHLQADRLTGMYLKNVLFSAAGRDLIDAAIPGPKRFVLLDCQHAGAANSYGDGQKIDEYFGSLRGIFQRVALEEGIPHVPIRLGGDEFALVIPSDERANQFLKKVIVHVERSRAERLGPGTEELGSYVVERDTMRMIRNAYRREAEMIGAAPTPEGFRKYLREGFLSKSADSSAPLDDFHVYLRARGIDTAIQALESDPSRRELAEALYTAYLQKYVALSLIVGMRAPAGRFSLSSVELGENPRWEDYHLAEGVASKRIQASKDKVFTLEVEAPVSVNPGFVVKQHESATCRAFVEREGEFRRLRECVVSNNDNAGKQAADRYRLTMLAVSDPNLPGTVRGDLIHDIPAEVILGQPISGPLYALVVNVPSFGVFNNSKGYVDADRMLAAVLASAARDFPPLAVVRQGGGRLVLLGQHPPDYADLAPLTARLNQVVVEHFGREDDAYGRMLIEYGERIALSSQWREGRFVIPPIDFGSCRAGVAVIPVQSGEPLRLGNM